MAGPSRGARELGLLRESGLAYVSRQIEYMFGDVRDSFQARGIENGCSIKVRGFQLPHADLNCT